MGFPEIVALFWQRRRVLVYFVVVAMVVGVGVALTLKPKYQARVVLVPASMADARGAGDALGGRLADLADMAGLGAGSSAALEKALAVLSSREFTVSFLQQERALPTLFPDNWDQNKGVWKKGAPPGAVARLLKETRQVLRLDQPSGGMAPGDDENGEPSSWEAFKVFDRMRVITRDKKTGLITVAVTWRDPQQAAQWANRLVSGVNEALRARAMNDAERNLEYLKEQLEKTSQIEMRDVLFRLGEVEERKAMLAHVRHEYAFEVVDPAVPPKEKSSPSRVLFVISSAMVGFLLGVITILAQSARRSVSARTKARAITERDVLAPHGRS